MAIICEISHSVTSRNLNISEGAWSIIHAYSPVMESPAQAPITILPPAFEQWFESRGWQARSHQLALLEKVRAGCSTLLIAPTGGGKTLAGFLPTLTELAEAGPRKPGIGRGTHTLYISPLKALAVDIARNLEAPIAEMGLDIKVETRTGDTPASRRQRQKTSPPDILLTTPEQLALLLAYQDAERFFKSLKCVVLDELHALVTSKRGDLLALGLARLEKLAPGVRRIGLSATVQYPDDLRRYLVPQQGEEEQLSDFVEGEKGAPPRVSVLASEAHIPWAGHSARHAIPEIYNAIQAATLTLVFVNTRSQAEIIFSELWKLNDENLPIALHHGSLAVEQRRKVEAAMASGKLKAVVCTSTLDLGIDWGEVDLVIQVGAPKGASRLLQRIGRANHRMDEASRALLIPSNRFEVMECTAAKEAAEKHILDGEPPRIGALDVLAQHIMGVACAAPFDLVALYEEVCTAAPYQDLSYEDFEAAVDFVATGGYALRTYDRYRRIVKTPEGLYRVANPTMAQRYRMNVGTIVEAPMLKVRLVKPGKSRSRGGGRVLGEVEEWMVGQLKQGDTFLFAGQVLSFEAIQETHVLVSHTVDENPMVPSYQGGKFPLSTYLADRVRHIVSNPESWQALPQPVSEWLELQRQKSVLPKPGEMLVETFPRGGKHYLVCYPFEGRLALQTLGMLITRRLERLSMHPLGFVASEYALAIWGLEDMGKLDLAALFEEDMLGDDLDAWLTESALLKRTFRNCAVIGGLIERRFPGQEKSGRQVTFSSDLIYDVLRDHEPDHILLRATFADAATGLLDIERLGMALARIKGNIIHRRLPQISPLAVPVMLEIGRVPIYGEANEALLDEVSADDLIKEAMA